MICCGTGCWLDDKGVIHIPEPHPWWEAVFMPSVLNSFMNKLVSMGLIGEPIATP